MNASPAAEARRTGDSISIPGDYQHRARERGPAVQRYWHYEKERMVRSFSPPAPGDAVLDVGCGSGVIAATLARMGAKVLAVDGNPLAIEYGRQTFRIPGLAFRLGLVDELDLPEAGFDRIYCLEVVEHLYANQVGDLLGSFRRLLRPGGVLTLTTPNYRGVWPAIEAVLDLAHAVPRLAGEQHVSRFDRGSLRTALTDRGWVVEQLRTFSTVAPFAALLSWRLAGQLSLWEDRLSPPFGSILWAVARNPA